MAWELHAHVLGSRPRPQACRDLAQIVQMLAQVVCMMTQRLFWICSIPARFPSTAPSCAIHLEARTCLAMRPKSPPAAVRVRPCLRQLRQRSGTCRSLRNSAGARRNGPAEPAGLRRMARLPNSTRTGRMQSPGSTRVVSWAVRARFSKVDPRLHASRGHRSQSSNSSGTNSTGFPPPVARIRQSMCATRFRP